MTTLTHKGGWVIIFSFVFALMLVLIPVPSWLSFAWPEWVLMVLIYWCLALPQRVGVGIGWFAGLLVDVAQGTLLGQHALAMALTAFLILKLHQRIRVFPLLQQAVIILMIVMLSRLVQLWVLGLSEKEPPVWWFYMIPAVGTAVMWPGVFTFMRFLRRYYRVS